MGKPRGEILSGTVLAALQDTYQDVRTGAWRQAVWDAFRFHSRHEGAPADFLEILRRLRLEPDAYAISKDEHWLHFFEIEVYNPMTNHKLEMYGKLALEMDYYRIEFGVLVVNKYGHINEVETPPYFAAGALERPKERVPSIASTRVARLNAERLTRHYAKPVQAS